MTLQPALAARLQAALGKTGLQLEVDPDMPDGQCLLFHYPSVFRPGAVGYVRPVVKIELGVRSDDWPHEEKSVQPYVIEHFPSLDSNAACTVRVLAAERTFWEKDCLLHQTAIWPSGEPTTRKCLVPCSLVTRPVSRR